MIKYEPILLKCERFKVIRENQWNSTSRKVKNEVKIRGIKRENKKIKEKEIDNK